MNTGRKRAAARVPTPDRGSDRPWLRRRIQAEGANKDIVYDAEGDGRDADAGGDAGGGDGDAASESGRADAAEAHAAPDHAVASEEEKGVTDGSRMHTGDAELILLEDENSRGSNKLFSLHAATVLVAGAPASVAAGSTADAAAGDRSGVQAVSASADADAAAVTAVTVAPFFSRLQVVTGGHSVRTATTTARPVLKLIIDDVMDAFEELFSACKLSRPNAWEEVSVHHLDVMTRLIGRVLQCLNTATVDASRMDLKPESLMLFREGEMLDDSCVDWMLKCLVEATGTRMVGVKGNSPGSPLVMTNSDLAGSHFVLGVAYAELLRRLGNQKTKLTKDHDTSDAGPVGPAAFQNHESCESWVVPGVAGESEKEKADTTLKRAVKNIVGTENVDAALNGSLDPFEKKNILVVATKSCHSKVILLQNPSKGGRPDSGTWHVVTYDSAGASQWDPDLRAGVSKLLTATGLKELSSRFKYSLGKSMQQLKMNNICGFLAFINTVQIVTGESLAQEHCARAVGVIRVFFVLWCIKIAESQGAIQGGYLEQSMADVMLGGYIETAHFSAPLVRARARPVYGNPQ